MDIAVDMVSDIVVRLRAVEVKEADTDPDSGSNPINDGATDVLVSGTDDATEQEVRDVIRSLNDDERTDLLALLYVGRGDVEAEDWDEAVRFARERQEAGDSTIKEFTRDAECRRSARRGNGSDRRCSARPAGLTWFRCGCDACRRQVFQSARLCRVRAFAPPARAMH